MVAPVVFVDDSDINQIIYHGPGNWSGDNATSLNQATGIIGPVYNNTITGCQGECSFEFWFSGTDVVVFTALVRDSLNDTVLATTTCAVDGVSYATNRGSVDETWYGTCQPTSLADTEHVLTMNISNPDFDTTILCLDLIQYSPSASLLTETAGIVYNNFAEDTTLRIDNTDEEAQFIFSDDWRAFNEDANGTETTGATLEYTFNGSYIGFYGYHNVGTVTGTYSIDGEPPVPFATLPFIWHYDRFFFADNLSHGQHTILVNNTGTNSSNSFVFDYFVIRTFTDTNTDAALPPSPTPSLSINNSKNNIGVVVGSVVGGMVLFIIIGVLYLLWRRCSQTIYSQIHPYRVHTHVPGPSLSPQADLPPPYAK